MRHATSSCDSPKLYRKYLAAGSASYYFVCASAPCLRDFQPNLSTEIDKELNMISWAVTFLVVALVAAVLGFSGIAGTAANLAWICAVVGIILAIVFAVRGRSPRL